MIRPGEKLHAGLGQWATLAARCRSSDNYCAGAGIEQMMGEARRFGPNGETMFATFDPVYTAEHDRRCHDAALTRDYAPPLPWWAYGAAA